MLDATLINMGNLALAFSIAIGPAVAVALWPNANIALTVVIAAIPTLFNGLVYGLMGAAMPRSGGDYVWAGRIWHPAVGFMANWGLTFSMMMAFGLYSQLLVTGVTAPGLTALGLVSGNSSLTSLGTTIAQPGWTFALGTLQVIFLAALMLAGNHIVKRFFRILAIPTVGSAIVTMIVFLFTSHEQFVANFNHVMAGSTGTADTYGKIMSQAQAAHYAFPSQTLTAALLAIPLGYTLYVGFTYSVYAGGEVKQPARSQPISILVTLGLNVVLLPLTIFAFYNTVGWDFFHALNFVSTQPHGVTLPISTYTGFFAGIASNNVVINVVIVGGLILTVLMLNAVLLLLPIRCLFAWAFDRLFPEQITKVTQRGTPWVATIVVALVTELFFAIYNFTSFFTLTANYTLIFSICFFIVGIVAVMFPYRRPELFQSAPPLARYKILGVPLLALAGAIQAAMFLIIIITSIMLPAFSGPVGWQSISFIAGLYLTPVLIYYGVRAVNRRRGIDLDLMWKQIPPE
jgi:amino acid transporter